MCKGVNELEAIKQSDKIRGGGGRPPRKGATAPKVMKSLQGGRDNKPKG
jgi:hypothetical protein